MSDLVRRACFRHVSPQLERRLARLVSTLVVMGLMLALPLVARADDDDKPSPPDPQAMAVQGKVFMVIGVMAGGAIAWYVYRRWQLNKALASGQYTDGQGTQ